MLTGTLWLGILFNKHTCSVRLVCCRAAELAASLPVPLDSAPQTTHSPTFVREFSTYSYGKSLFDLKEFRRAWHALKECQCTEGVFLRLYSLYLVSWLRGS